MLTPQEEQQFDDLLTLRDHPAFQRFLMWLGVERLKATTDALVERHSLPDINVNQGRVLMALDAEGWLTDELDALREKSTQGDDDR